MTITGNEGFLLSYSELDWTSVLIFDSTDYAWQCFFANSAAMKTAALLSLLFDTTSLTLQHRIQLVA